MRKLRQEVSAGRWREGDHKKRKEGQGYPKRMRVRGESEWETIDQEQMGVVQDLCLEKTENLQ